jgi:hypothetical protein
MSACRGEVPPAREALKAFLEPEQPGGHGILEPGAMTRRQRLTLPGTIGNLELHCEPFTCGIRRDRNARHPTIPSSQEPRERANHTDKIRARAIFIDKERT